MFEGFRSRWIDALWWACCTAWQTATKKPQTLATDNLFSSQYRVIGTPRTSSITKKVVRHPLLLHRKSRAMSRMLHHRERLTLCFETGDKFARVQAEL